MTDQLPNHAVQVDGGVSIQEAASLQGCSEKTIRRRIKAGSLVAHQLPTSQGYEWRVHLDSAPDQAPPLPAVQLNGHAGQVPSHAVQVDTQVSEHSDEAILRALGLVDRLQKENMELAGRVGFLQAKLQSAEEQLQMLTSGQPTAEAAEPSAAAVVSPWQRFISWFRL